MEYIEESEAKAIAVQFAKARGSKGFTAEECCALLNEAQRIRIENAMISLVIDGTMVCEWDGKKMSIRTEAPNGGAKRPPTKNL